MSLFLKKASWFKCTLQSKRYLKLKTLTKGFQSLEYDSQDDLPGSNQFEDGDKVTETEREKLRTDVTEAMAENDTIDEETEEVLIFFLFFFPRFLCVILDFHATVSDTQALLEQNAC